MSGSRDTVAGDAFELRWSRPVRSGPFERDEGDIALVLQALKGPPADLFWSAPLAAGSDFSAEDPLALDYLGQQVGLWLFRGFTTRTSRAQYYAVVLYGLHLADRAVRAYGYSGDDKTRTELFERWERLWALATLEHRGGQLARGDEDAMRGVRGAARAWFPGDRPLPLDFPLISRQSELGGLGAYLSSLRAYGLVFPGSLRVTPAARDIIDAFWDEKGDRDTGHEYEAYALEALRRDVRAVPRKRGRLTLAGLGRRSRLSSLVRRKRTAQQRRLWEALFLAARDDSTLALAERLIDAHADGVTAPEPLLEGLLAGRWGALAPPVAEKVAVALAFGKVARALLGRFNRAYGCVDERGWVVDVGDAAAAAFPAAETPALRAQCQALLDLPGAARFGRLEYHGPGLLALLRQLLDADGRAALDHLLAFQRAVQRSRRGGGAWLHEEQGKLTLRVTSYTGHRSEVGFPSLKLPTVRQLLADLGRIVEEDA